MNKVVAKDSAENVIEKSFKGYLIIDYRSGKMRVVKQKPESKKLKSFEIPVTIDIKLLVRSNPDIVAKGEFEIPPTQVHKMVLEMI